ncbi:4-hydroxy-tetrahydrodipicolinate reductase [Maricaulis sp. CAU 1757]
MAAIIKIALAGATGRLGRAIGAAILEAHDLELCGALVRPGSEHEGRDVIAHLGGSQGALEATSDLATALHGADVVIDASQPEVSVQLADYIANSSRSLPLVSGVTGHDEGQETRLRTRADSVAILKTGNFSLGVAMMEALVRQAARLPAEQWDAEIEETHHRRKRDAPSGTALMLGRTIAQARGSDLDNVATWSRHGETGARDSGTVGFSVTRGGGVIGEHAVRFLSEVEEITIAHRAFERSVFATGALAAARWMVNGGEGRQAGLYSMHDVVESH